ncbi:hypothetical protein AB1285_20430 [Microbacterium sp. NRRL B-14842]|uniref:hypothetical protein n=1 Tax=Microbacterium sp. NRRL B-14842 TaxID=3162881 RepID=UPI003D29F995
MGGRPAAHGEAGALGPFDLPLASVGTAGITRLIDRLRDIRGALMVDAYLR